MGLALFQMWRRCWAGEQGDQEEQEGQRIRDSCDRVDDCDRCCACEVDAGSEIGRDRRLGGVVIEGVRLPGRRPKPSLAAFLEAAPVLEGGQRTHDTCDRCDAYDTRRSALESALVL